MIPSDAFSKKDLVRGAAVFLLLASTSPFSHFFFRKEKEDGHRGVEPMTCPADDAMR